MTDATPPESRTSTPNRPESDQDAATPGSKQSPTRKAGGVRWYLLMLGAIILTHAVAYFGYDLLRAVREDAPAISTVPWLQPLAIAGVAVGTFMSRDPKHPNLAGRKSVISLQAGIALYGWLLLATVPAMTSLDLLRVTAAMALATVSAVANLSIVNRIQTQIREYAEHRSAITGDPTR